MTIGCTRCGATEEGSIILPAIAFKFKHNRGCAHGLGPLTLIPANKKLKKATTEKVEAIVEALEKSDVIVEKEIKKSKPIVEKLKVFGKKD